MAALLHDPTVRAATRARLQKLTVGSSRAWGRMTVDQMLWHCNEILEAALGRRAVTPIRIPLPKSWLRFILLKMPWPKGAKTHPDWIAGARHDFEAERARTLRLLEEFTAKSLGDDDWADSPAAGRLSGREASELQAKHLDHHLRQFGV